MNLQRIKIQNFPILTKKVEKKCYLKTFRSFTVSNSVENVTDQDDTIVEEEKNIHLSNEANENKSSPKTKASDELWPPQHLLPYQLLPQSRINRIMNYKLMEAMLFGQKLIIDCSYDDKMNKRQSGATAESLKKLICINRKHVDPFDIHFCHAIPTSKLFKSLAVKIPTIFNDAYPINLHKETYSEKFPQQNLVYLTPYSENILEYNHDDVYIIGATVHGKNCYKVAQSEGLPTAKLPLDVVKGRKGGPRKFLSLDEIVGILLDLKSSIGAKEAFEKNFPRKRILTHDEMIEHLSQDFNYFKESRLASGFWGGHRLRKSVSKCYYRKKHWPANLTIEL